MRTLAVIALGGLGACASSSAPRPATPAASTVEVARAKADGALDVEPETPAPMRAPATPTIAFAVDDHAGAHRLSHDAALDAIAGYDDFAVLRVVSATRDVVTFDVVDVDGVRRATFGVVRGVIDPDSFAPRKPFVGAYVLPARSQNAIVYALASVRDESDARGAMAKIASRARSRRGG